jgi:hypothetical protein
MLEEMQTTMPTKRQHPYHCTCYILVKTIDFFKVICKQNWTDLINGIYHGNTKFPVIIAAGSGTMLYGSNLEHNRETL